MTNPMAQSEQETFKHALIVSGIVLLMFLGFLASVQPVRATTDGTGGTDDGWAWSAHPTASRIAASASGALDSLSIYWTAAGAGNVNLGIYSDNGTHPNTLLASSGSVAQAAGAGWQVIAVTGVNINSGTHYWIAEQESAGRAMASGSDGLPGSSYYALAYPTLDNPWSASSTPMAADRSVSFRMTYTPATTSGAQFSNNLTKYATPNTYDPSAVHGFQITWTAASGLFNTTNVTFESNFTGAVANYTNATTPALFNRSASVFQINFTTAQTKGAAAYAYRWFANNGTDNVTATTYYTIIPAAVNVQVAPLTQAITYGTTLNQNCTNNVTLGKCTLWRGQTSPPSVNITLMNNTVEALTAGTWYFNATYSGTDNYSAATSAVQTITINKALTTLHVALNGTEADSSYLYNFIVNATAWPDIAGGTVSLVRNGSAASNPYYGNLSARAHNFTATFSHDNYTATAVMRYFTVMKSATTTAISITPSSSVAENTPVTVTATSNVSYVFFKDGVVITSPYGATLPFGFYNFTMELPDIENYTGGVTTAFLTVASGGSGCTTPQTFAFTKMMPGTGNMSTLNFTDLYAGGLVKWDLSDVWLNTSNITAYRNQSNGNYYLVVNTTNVTQFPVQFGNYIGNMSWANTTNSTGVLLNFTAMTGYSELNPYYFLTFNEEMTNIMQLPPGANRTLSLFCAGGVSSFALNNSKIIVAAVMQLDEIKATVSYSATEVYYRNLIARSPVEYRNYYLVDANLNQVAQLELTLFDSTGNYQAGDVIKIKKQIEGTLVTITEGYIDAEMKIIVYLINADRYQVYIDDGTTERSIGYLYIDPTDLTKTIVITSGITTVDDLAYNVSYSLNMTGKTIIFNYIDGANQTTNVSIWVYNAAAALLYYGSSTNHSVASFAYVTANENATYRAVVHISRTSFSEFDITKLLTGLLTGIDTNEFLDTDVKVPAAYMLVLSLGLVMMIPMLFGGAFGAAAGLFMVLIAVVLAYFELLEISVVVLVLAGMLAAFNVIGKRRQ